MAGKRKYSTHYKNMKAKRSRNKRKLIEANAGDPILASQTSSTTQQGVTSQQDETLHTEVAPPPPDLTNLPKPKIIIANVYKYFQNEYETLKNLTGSDCELNPLANYLGRTAEATGVSEQTVTAILEERKETAVKKRESRKRRRVKLDQKEQDVSPIAEDPPCDTTEDHQADVHHQTVVDHQRDEGQQMEQEEHIIETLKVEVDDEYDPAVVEKITTDPLVTEMRSTVYQMFATENVPTVAIKTEPVEMDYPPSTSAAVIPQVTPAGSPFLVIKTEPREQTGIQTQYQSCFPVQDPLRIVQVESSSHNMEQFPGQPNLPDHTEET